MESSDWDIHVKHDIESLFALFIRKEPKEPEPVPEPDYVPMEKRLRYDDDEYDADNMQEDTASLYGQAVEGNSVDDAQKDLLDYSSPSPPSRSLRIEELYTTVE